MKEVTVWNGKPRWMLCWDYFEARKQKEYVIYILTEEEMNECNAAYSVRGIANNYAHCAEIEKE